MIPLRNYTESKRSVQLILLYIIYLHFCIFVVKFVILYFVAFHRFGTTTTVIKNKLQCYCVVGLTCCIKRQYSIIITFIWQVFLWVCFRWYVLELMLQCSSLKFMQIFHVQSSFCNYHAITIVLFTEEERLHVLLLLVFDKPFPPLCAQAVTVVFIYLHYFCLILTIYQLPNLYKSVVKIGGMRA